MDQKLYQKTFNQIHMSAQRAGEVRAELAARCADKEATAMTTNRKRPMAALIAVCAVLALSVTAFASGGRVLEHVFQMMTGSTLSQGIDEDGNYYFEDTAPEPVSPVELREDGRLYLTINGENRDITGDCSYETPYIYQCTGEDGLLHTFIIGGEPEDIGWVEYTSDEVDGTAVSGVVLSIGDDVEPTTLPWLNKGLEETMGGSNLFEFVVVPEDGSVGGYTVVRDSDTAATITVDGETHTVENSTCITLTDNQE